MLDFERNIEEFRGKNIQVIAASVDTLEDARKTVERYKLSFTVGCGLIAKEISSKTGSFYDEKGEYLYPAGFIINPEGKIEIGVYSTGAIGRLVAKECSGFIDYLTKS